jgi:hypothetical protein
MDRLLNARCVDLSAAVGQINAGNYARGTFGQDKVAPTAAYVDPATDPTAAGANGSLNNAGNIGNFNVIIALSDDASGFSATPILTMITRLAINPATNAPATTTSAFGCPSGRDNNNNCITTATSSQIRGDANGITDANGNVYAATADASGCVGCGYFFFTQTPLDLARNAAPVLTRSVVIDYNAPTVGGIAVPATLIGGTSASFATSAADNLDLISSDYTIAYAANPSGNPAPGANLPIRAGGPALGVAFDNTLTTASSFSINVPFFIRSIATTSAANQPQNNPALPTSIAVRAYDAASNPSAPGTAPIQAANVPQTTPTDFTQPQTGQPAGAAMQSFQVSNAATNVSNCPAAGCAGNAAPANPTSVALTATAVGGTGPNFQFINPFTQVQFYYYDVTAQEYVLIGSAVAPVVTDQTGANTRTFTWTLSPAWDPPASLGSGLAPRIIAVGVNARGDALASAASIAINLTNP